jgi:DNA-binding HxlR family transcriptional regulator
VSTNKSRNEDTASIEKPGPIFIGRWTPKILFPLKERPYRHAELRRDGGNVSQRMLTGTLRYLESAGLITVRADRKVGGRAEALAPRFTAPGTRMLLVRGWQPEVVQNTAIHRTERHKSEIQRRDICAQYASQAQQ